MSSNNREEGASNIRVGVLIPKCKKQKIKLPSRIEELCLKENIDLIDIDVAEQNLDEIEGFDILLHKITDFCNDVGASESEIQMKKDLVTNYASKHPKMKIVDHFENCEKITSREYQTEVLQAAQCEVDNIKVFVPKIVFIPQNWTLEDLENLIKTENIKFPILSKPQNASLTEGSHDMVLVFAFENLKDIQGPCLIQEFHNHGGVVYKVFTVGENYKICQRPSVKDIHSCNKETIRFDTRNVSKTGRAYLPDIHESDPNKRVWLSCDEQPDMLNHQVVKEVIRKIHNKTKFHLYGFDILIDNETRNYALIDLNQFPGYSGIKPCHFDTYLVELFKKLGKD